MLLFDFWSRSIDYYFYVFVENLEKRVPHIHYGDSSENKNHGAKRVPPSDAGEDGSENKSDGATRVAQFNFGEDSSENKHDGAKRVPHVHYGDSTENKNHGAKRLLVRLLSRALLELDEK